MLERTIVYINDALDRESYQNEPTTLRYLKENVKPRANVLGFATPTEAQDYFKDVKNSCDLFVCDHNLWWDKQPDESYRFRYSNNFMKYLYSIRPDLGLSPVVIYTDGPEYAHLHWRGDNMSFNTVVTKYNYDDERKPWEILAEQVNLLLTDSRNIEGGYSNNQKER